METNFNLGSLKIVYNPLMEYFKNIQSKVIKNIELLKENKDSSENISIDYDTLDLFIKVQASLKMIGLNGLVKVISLNEEAFEYTKGVVSNEDKLNIFEEIHNNLTTIDYYLKQLIDGEMDQPTKLFDPYKDLATLMKKKVSIKDLFFPKLDLIQTKENSKINRELRIGKVITKENKEQVIEELNFYKNKISNSLLIIFDCLDNNGKFSSIEEKNDYHAECKSIYDYLSNIQMHKFSKSYYVLFGIQKLLISISTPVHNNSFEGIVGEYSFELKKHLNNIILSLEYLIEDILALKENDKTGSLKTREDLTKETLFFIVNIINNNNSLMEMPIFKEICTYFSFNFYTNQLKGIPIEVSLSQSNPSLIKDVENSLMQIKEEVVLLTGKNLSENMFEVHLNKVITLSSQLKDVVKDDDVISNFLNSFISINEGLRNKTIDFSVEMKREISLSVALLDFSVHSLLSGNKNNESLKNELKLEIQRIKNILSNKSNDKLRVPSLDIKTKKEEERKVLLKIFDELSKELNINEEILDNIIRTKDVDKEELKPVLNSLNNAHGIFIILGNKNLSLVVEKIIFVWDHVFNKGLSSVNPDLMHNSISWLSGLTLYVNAYKQNNILEAEEIQSKILSQFKNYFGSDVIIDDYEDSHDLESINSFDNVETLDMFKNESETTVENIEQEIIDVVENVDINKVNNVVVEERTDNVKVFKEVDTELSVDKSNKTTVLIDDDNYDFVEEKTDNEEMLEIFLLEMEEVKENLDTALSELYDDRDNIEALTTIRRAFHTLKGSGRMVDLNNLGEIAWIVEEKLNSILSLNLTVTDNTLSAISYIVGKFDSWRNDLSNDKVTSLSVELEKDKFYSLLDSSTIISEATDEIDSITDNFIEIPIEEVDKQIENEINEVLQIEEETEIVSEVMDIINPVVEEFEQDSSVKEIQDDIIIENNDYEEIHNNANDINNNENTGVENIEELENSENVISLEADNGSVSDSIPVIETVVETTELEPVSVDKVVEEKVETNINILGKDIPLSLYNLFSEESAQHLQELRSFVHNPKNVKKVNISYDFMRHAHTLASIARTVNLEEFAVLVNGIENIANISIEKERSLSKAEMTMLKYVVDNLDIFNDPDNDLTAKSEHYLDVLDTINELKEDLNKDLVDSYQINSTKETLSIEELLSSQEFMSKISEEIKNSVGSLIKEIVSENIKNFNVNFEELEKSIDKTIERNVSEQISKNSDVINKTLQEKIEESEKLSKNISTLKDDIKELKDSQEKLDQQNKKSVDSLKNDLRILADIVKKKSSKRNSISSPSGMVLPNQERDGHQKEIGKGIALFLEKHPNLKLILEEKISSIENEIDEDMYIISSSEIEEMFEKIDDIFFKFKNSTIENEDVSSLKRYIHTLKGSVRMYGNNQMGAIAHRLESLLDYIENHNIEVNEISPLLQSEVEKLKYLNKNYNLTLSMESVNWIDSIIGETSDYDDYDLMDIDRLLPSLGDNLNILNNNEKTFNIQYIKVMSKMLDSIINEAGEIRLSRTTLEGTLDNNRKYIVDLKNSSLKIQKMLKEIELKAEMQILAQESNLKDNNKDFDPLEFDRYTRLQELTRFMHEAVEDVKDSVMNMEDLYGLQENAIIKQSILTDSILDSLMDVRLISVDSVADKLYKVVRLTAKDSGKNVMLELTGEKHEVDRVVLERIQHPLEHILRNCVVHGIESQEVREKNGKNPKGTIYIDISVDGNFIIFNISDDGSGIDLNKIYEKGVEKGFLEIGNEYSKEELTELIFKSGFTTASSLSQNAGRGIGMDVVRNEVLSLGGSVEILTEEGKGTSFIIALPLSVATNQAMLTTVDDKLFAIPAMLIDEVISLKKDELQNGYKNKFITFREETYPLYYIGHLTGVYSSNSLPVINAYNTLIIVSYLGQKIILHIDNFQKIEEVIIKSAGKVLGKINGLLGVTLLGDGKEGLVINPVSLVEHFDKYIKPKSLLSLKNADIECVNDEEVPNNKMTILVVDDSITIRRVTSKTLEKHNFNVVLAKDGENALEQLQVVTPDIILSDIEMPVMDGFELVKNIRNINKFKEIPIIMITSRTAEKHKKYAFSLGANSYIGKPYQEDNLIKTINDLLKNKK